MALSKAEKHPVGTYAHSIAVGDVTGDGKDDAVLVTVSEIYVFVQTTDGHLTNVQSLTHGDWGDYSVLPTFPAALIRLGSNPLPDLVMGYRDGYGIFHNDGTGHFATEVRQSGPPSRSLLFRALDLDRDNQPDLVGNGANGFLLTAHYGDGRAGIRESRQLQPAATSAQSLGFTFSDMTADGAPDAVIAVLENGATSLSIFPSDGSSFGPSVVSLNLEGSWAGLSGVEAGDFDGDGRTDLVAVEHANTPNSYIAVFHQIGPLLFGKQQTMSSYDFAGSPHAVDIDGDSATDIVVSHGGWGSVGVYLQKGGVLQPEQRFSVPQANLYDPNSTAIGDLNSDGCKDLALADSNLSNGLLVLYGVDCARVK